MHSIEISVSPSGIDSPTQSFQRVSDDGSNNNFSEQLAHKMTVMQIESSHNSHNSAKLRQAHSTDEDEKEESPTNSQGSGNTKALLKKSKSIKKKAAGVYSKSPKL